MNSALVWLYWNIGKRIREDVLQDKRAKYGDEIVATLSRQLTIEFGKGFTEESLRRMIQFAALFPDEQIVAALSGQLSWSHFVEIIPLDDPLKREFYAEMRRIERWSVRTLRQKIDRLLFERTAVSKKPDELIRRDLKASRDEDRLTPDLVFRDPYFLDFLGLSNEYDERDIENAILRELEAFILELGSDFAFVARQKRMSVDSEDYYLEDSRLSRCWRVIMESKGVKNRFAFSFPNASDQCRAWTLHAWAGWFATAKIPASSSFSLDFLASKNASKSIRSRLIVS